MKTLKQCLKQCALGYVTIQVWTDDGFSESEIDSEGIDVSDVADSVREAFHAGADRVRFVAMCVDPPTGEASLFSEDNGSYVAMIQTTGRAVVVDAVTIAPLFIDPLEN